MKNYVGILFSFLIPILCLADTKGNQEPWTKMMWEDFKSPVTTEIKTVFLIGSGATVGLAIAEDQVSDPAQAEVVEAKPLGNWSKFGDYSGQMIPNALYALGMWSAGENMNAGLMTRASFMAALTTNVLKYTVREPRPTYPYRKEAFPSGHTATAFAFASVVSCRHSLPWAISAYSLATLVGFSRMNDNAHLLHHVVGGAVIGVGYGFGICWRQEALDGGKSSLVRNFSLQPIDEGGEIVWRKDF